jgi:copper chaperone CopZ
MRQLFDFAALVAVVGVVQAAPDDAVACKALGAHLCCNNCVNSVKEALAPVKGVTNLVVDRAKKEIVFTASDKDVAVKAHEALVKAGFGFTFTAGDKTIELPAQKLEGMTATMVIKGVHDCCPQCTGAINGLFKEGNAKVAISGKGAQRDLTVTGADLDPTAVLQMLQKAGFTGVVESSKK